MQHNQNILSMSAWVKAMQELKREEPLLLCGFNSQHPQTPAQSFTYTGERVSNKTRHVLSYITALDASEKPISAFTIQRAKFYISMGNVYAFISQPINPAEVKHIERPEGEPWPDCPSYLWSNQCQCYVLKEVQPCS